jgi:hypothetical protein
MLRDTLYLLQGISGKHVQFSSNEEDQNTLVFLEDAVSLIYECLELVLKIY